MKRIFFKGISSINFFGSIQYRRDHKDLRRDHKDLMRTIRSFNEIEVLIKLYNLFFI